MEGESEFYEKNEIGGSVEKMSNIEKRFAEAKDFDDLERGLEKETGDSLMNNVSIGNLHTGHKPSRFDNVKPFDWEDVSEEERKKLKDDLNKKDLLVGHKRSRFDDIKPFEKDDKI